MHRLVCLVLLFASSARASDSWIKCIVGRGGLDSAEEVYDRTMEALARGDADALIALGPDQCAVFRGVKQLGPSVFEHFADQGGQWRKALAALSAFLAIEGVSADALATPAADNGIDEDWTGATVLTNAGSEQQRLTLRVTTLAIDGRWYLWRPPTLEQVRDSFFLREYRRLADRLIRQLRSQGTDSALQGAIANWFKVEAKSIGAAQRALGVLPRLLAIEAAKVSARVAFAVGASEMGEELVTTLAPIFPSSLRLTGLAACDDYLLDLLDCVTDDEDALEVLESMAKGLSARHHDGDSDIEGECRDLAQRLRDDGCSEVMP